MTDELDPPLDWDSDPAAPTVPAPAARPEGADVVEEEAALPALAAAVEQLDSRLTDAESLLVQLGGDVGSVIDGDVGATLEQLSHRLDAVEDLTGRGHWAPAVDELEQFVAWLADTYYLRDELHRWENNTAVQRELNALHIAWRHVCGPKAGPFDALSWHDHLERVTARLTDHRSRARRRAY